MRETFSTHKGNDDNASKRERLKSQGAVVKTNTITFDNVKPTAKRAIQDELN